MKDLLKMWFVGFKIMKSVALLPAIRWLVSKMEAGWFVDVPPRWWSLFCETIYVIYVLLVPLFVCNDAKRCLLKFLKSDNSSDLYSEVMAEIKNEKRA